MCQHAVVLLKVEMLYASNLTQWIITQSKGFTKKGIGKVSKSVRAYVYSVSVFTSQFQAILSIVGNSASAVDAQQVFRRKFHVLINEKYSISVYIVKNQSVLEHALSKVDFSVGTGIYTVPGNLNLNIKKTVEYNNEILISNTDMKTGSNRNKNKAEVYHKKSTKTQPQSSSHLESSQRHLLPLKCI